ncbi:LptF/LptG family permease [Amylibacter sp.]|nr:LptF/LptG family permease [Amylibacter sp.]
MDCFDQDNWIIQNKKQGVSMTLAIYFGKRYLISFIRVFLSIVLLVLLFDFLTNLNRLNGIEAQIWNALILSFLRTTTYLSLAMPLIIMLSALAFSVSLSRSNEFIVLRASGVSALKGLFSVILSAFFLGLISIFILDPLAGKMIGYYDIKLDKLRSKEQSQVLINDNGYWMRQATLNGHQIIKAVSVSNNGQRLHQVTIFNYDKNGLVKERFFSESAALEKNELLLTNTIKWSDTKIKKNPIIANEKIKKLNIKTEITPTQLLDGYASPETISPWNMNKQIKKVKSSGFSVLKYQSKKMEQYARPFLFIVMVILGTVFTLQNSRSRNIGISVVLAVASGFFLHFFQNFCTTLGRSGEIPLIVATWSPIISIGLIAMTLFLHYEDG